jgi:5S rRNA maturation endonuclease (ribonuclease M5)
MTTYTITINERTNSGKKLMEYLKSIEGIKVEKAKTKNLALDEAIDDIKNGRTYTAKNADDLIKSCLK